MRISSGELKGRRVSSRAAFAKRPGGHELRPTSAKVREALFDIMRSDVEGSSFLDLYAGTGAVGIEALSRGASEVTFVEENRVRCRSIGEAVARFGLGGRGVVECRRAQDFLRRSGASYDIIFADPPYASDELMNILPLVAEFDLLKPGGCLVIEHPSRLAPGGDGTLQCVKRYRYGDTMLSLYRHGI